MVRVDRSSLFLCMALILAALAAGVTPAPTSAATPVDFTQVTPDLVPASSDYITDTRGHSWDFNSAQSFGIESSRSGFIGGGSLSNGWFGGTTSLGYSKVWLLDATIPGIVPTPNEGGFRPIDTSRYRYLTFRMCSSANSNTIVYWHKDRSYAPGTFGSTKFKPVTAGCHLYSFDFVGDRPGGDGSLNWTGEIEGLAIQPTNAAGIDIRIDFARLSATPPSSGPAVNISWSPRTTAFDLFFDTDPNGSSATFITSISSSNSGSYTWTTPNLAPGTYYLIAKSGSAQSVSRAFVVNTPPSAQVLAPSYTSGPDFASAVAGNPWDMSDPADVQVQYNVAGGNFNNGVFSGTNTNGDPGLILNTPVPIDPQRFYYATYRMRVDGEQDIFTGSVTRLLWWTGPVIQDTASTTKDIVVYEDWRTVTVDLRNAPLEPDAKSTWSNGNKLGFRLDPHEFPNVRGFQVDDVKLTGNDRASTSFAIRYNSSDANGQAVSISFFYDTDRSGANGTRISCAAPSGSRGSRRIYLPAVQNGVSSGDVGGSTCLWNLNSVGNGDYYIYMVANDGVNTTTVYSDTPVEVRK